MSPIDRNVFLSLGWNWTSGSSWDRSWSTIQGLKLVQINIIQWFTDLLTTQPLFLMLEIFSSAFSLETVCINVFFLLFALWLRSLMFTWMREIPSIFCLPMLQYLAQYQHIPPRPPYYAFFAFLWLFMGRITARFTHTGDGQRLQGVGDRLSNLWEWWNCIFSDHISFILNKMWDKQKAIKQCNDAVPWSHVIDEHIHDERFVQIMIMISPNKQRGWIKSWLLCNEGAVNPYC